MCDPTVWPLPFVPHSPHPAAVQTLGCHFPLSPLPEVTRGSLPLVMLPRSLPFLSLEASPFICNSLCPPINPWPLGLILWFVPLSIVFHSLILPLAMPGPNRRINE